jgi:hypothetical protein
METLIYFPPRIIKFMNDYSGDYRKYSPVNIDNVSINVNVETDSNSQYDKNDSNLLRHLSTGTKIDFGYI